MIESGLAPNIYKTTYWEARVQSDMDAHYIKVMVRDFRKAECISDGKAYVYYVDCPDHMTYPPKWKLCEGVAWLQEKLDNGDT